MPTPTYDLIATNVVSSTVSSVTFSSIPATYRDLVLVLVAAGTAPGGSAQIRFNGDTGANYYWVRMEGNGTTASTASGAVSFMPGSGNLYINTGLTYQAVINIMDYSATDKHKMAIHRVNQTVEPTYSGVGAAAHITRWENTSAINEILIYTSPNFVAGSTFYLYGIVS